MRTRGCGFAVFGAFGAIGAICAQFAQLAQFTHLEQFAQRGTFRRKVAHFNAKGRNLAQRGLIWHISGHIFLYINRHMDFNA
jgi:hypothetical protein